MYVSNYWVMPAKTFVLKTKPKTTQKHEILSSLWTNRTLEICIDVNLHYFPSFFRCCCQHCGIGQTDGKLCFWGHQNLKSGLLQLMISSMASCRALYYNKTWQNEGVWIAMSVVVWTQIFNALGQLYRGKRRSLNYTLISTSHINSSGNNELLFHMGE